MFLSDVAAIRALRQTDGAELHVWGSGDLIQTLLENDLVDELRLKIYPIVIGTGKKLFDRGVIPAAFTPLDATGTPSGIILANYARTGDIVTGTVGE